MINVKVEIAHDEDCWFVQSCNAVNLICWSDTEEGLRIQATDAIIFTLKEQNLETSEIVVSFSLVTLRESEKV